MSKHLHEIDIVLKPHDNRRLMDLCGQSDENIRNIEKRLGVDIAIRGNQIRVSGSFKESTAASQVINHLYAHTAKHELTKHDVHLAISQFGADVDHEHRDKHAHHDKHEHHDHHDHHHHDHDHEKYEPHAKHDHYKRAKHHHRDDIPHPGGKGSGKHYKDSIASKPYEKAHNHHSQLDAISGEEVAINTRYLKVYPRGQNQIQYLRNIEDYDVNFAVGPAGTGKTFLAIAAAVDMLASKRVERILLIRPVVEAGEHLGFLPGDLNQKIDPYLRPLFDALYAMLGHVEVYKLLEHNIIEAAPLAYMRGRTLNDSFVILDEAQNTTTTQMKMFLTRIGFGSKIVITGDITQIDLPSHYESGLNDALRLLSGLPDICFNYFTSTDIVRHPTVQRIVDAYERQEDQKKNGDNY